MRKEIRKYNNVSSSKKKFVVRVAVRNEDIFSVYLYSILQFAADHFPSFAQTVFGLIFLLLLIFFQLFSMPSPLLNFASLLFSP